MITFLAKKIIKDYKNYRDPKVREQYGVVTGAVGIVLNLFLCAIKFVAGTLSGSIAITADALNNLLDASSSVITLVGFKMANKTADHGHPFGHGRIEYITGLVVSMIIVFMGFEIGLSSFQKILNPETVEFSYATVVILIVSIAIKLYMAYYNFFVGQKIESKAIKATALDSLSDCISTAVVLISVLCFFLFGVYLDGYGGILVSVFIVYTGLKSAKEIIEPILGEAPSEQLIKEIQEIVMQNPEIIGMHDLIVHDYGPGRRIITLHVEVDGKGSFIEYHDMVDNIEYKLSKELSCEATIHIDPVDVDNKVIEEWKKLVGSIVETIDDSLTIHDLRTVPGKTHTNIIFDVVTPKGFKMKDEKLIREITNKIHEVHSGYHCIIKIDKSYI